MKRFFSSSGFVANVKALAAAESKFARLSAQGSPTCTLLVQSPPSIPIYLKKNSLLSMFFPSTGAGTSIDKLISSELKLMSWAHPAAPTYQRMISTVPVNMTISSDTQDSTVFKTFKILDLDGTADWAVFDKQAIQVLVGDNLSVRSKFVPSKVSKQLAQSLELTRKDRAVGLNSLTYNFITGRGSVGLSGNGEIVEVPLQQGETLLVSKKNLLALKVNGVDDLANMVYAQRLVETKEPETHSVPAAATVQTNSAWEYYYRVSAACKRVWTRIYNAVYNYFTSNNNYVNVVGPTTVVLQGSSRKIRTSSAVLFGTKPENFDHPVKAEDLLNYVTIKDGKTKWESTPHY